MKSYLYWIVLIMLDIGILFSFNFGLEYFRILKKQAFSRRVSLIGLLVSLAFSAMMIVVFYIIQ